MAEILEAASKLHKKQDRINFLRNNYSKQMHQVLAFGYDPRVKWLLPLDEDTNSDPPYSPADPEGMEPALYQEARKLYLFVRGGNNNLSDMKRQQLFINFLESIHPKDAKMILKIARKQTPFRGITQEIIESAFGEFKG